MTPERLISELRRQRDRRDTTIRALLDLIKRAPHGPNCPAGSTADGVCNCWHTTVVDVVDDEEFDTRINRQLNAELALAEAQLLVLKRALARATEGQ